jgi:pimeloyl-ACP methyl ester carboxylesterase
MTAQDLFVAGGDGTRIAVRDHGGDGPPLVLVHGHLGNLASFDDVATRLTASYRVVAYDQRGHGWSESGPTTADTYVADLAAVVTSLGLGPPVLWGQSFGSIVAAAAIAAGIEVRALVNEDGFIVDGDPPGEEELTEGRRVFPAGSLSAVLDGWSDAAAGMPAGVATGRRSILRHADGGIELRPTQTELTEKVRAMWSTSIAATYRGLTAPVLLLVAREGGLATSGHRERDVEELTRTAGGPVTVRWFDTDHWISALDPDGVAAALADFASDV